MFRRAGKHMGGMLALAMTFALAAMLMPYSVAMASSPNGSGGGGVAPMDPGWVQDPSFVQAKLDHRVIRTPSGQVQILAQAPSALVAPMYAPSLDLNTSVSGTAREPKGQSGYDDAGGYYYDYNFWKFCGPGATSVALYYWANSIGLWQTSGYYAEPRYWGQNYYSDGFWAYTKGHNAIVKLGMTESPAGNNWAYPGMLTWEYSYWDTAHFGTPLNRVHDTLNWEITGHASVNGFYVVVPSASVTLASLKNYAHLDIAAGVPFVVAAQTYLSASEHLPQWLHAIPHYVAVVGYDDTAKTFTIVDTCGPSCSDQGPYGVGKVSQQTLYDLIRAISNSNGGGLVW